MRIAVDAMGGDFAPANIVTGALRADGHIPGLEKIYLVGREPELRKTIRESGWTLSPRVEILHAEDVVGMDEPPAVAIRRKKDSSIARAVDLIKNGEADAVFSAGNTGAAVAATTLKLRTLPGVSRPGIATVMPTKKKPFVLIDAGATTDCTPAMLLQFAIMGSVYSREIIGHHEPVVGLLSIGGEETKGNEITKETYNLLKNSPLNFRGNVEGHDLFEGDVDVAVCDGFVGNVVLKTSESAAHALTSWLKDEFSRNPVRILGALLLRNAFRTLKRKADPAMYGGAPLLGVNGICIIGHGSSSSEAVFNGIRVATEAVTHQVNGKIMNQIAAWNAEAGKGAAP
jgi:phosphate acyltransferase